MKGNAEAHPPVARSAGRDPERFSRRTFLSSSAALVLAGAWSRSSSSQEPAPEETTDAWVRRLAGTSPKSMVFQGKTVEDCRAWQREFAAKLSALLGPHEPPKEWKVVVERRVELPDHVREELLLVAEGYPTLPLHLLVPLGKAERSRAGILALHGHGPLGYDAVVGKESRPGAAQEIQNLKYDYGRELVRRGYVVAAPCLTPFGRRLGNRESYGTEDPCAVTFIRMELLGKVLIAENLRDCLWAYRFLAGREGVDRTRLGCVGLSYGGRMAMLTSALEPGIRVAVMSGALNLLEERVLGHYSCGAQVIPGLLSYGDVPEIASLIAPRPSLWELGSRDDLVKPPWSDEALRRLSRAYQALGASGELQVDRFEGGHEWSGQKAYPLLERVLA